VVSTWAPPWPDSGRPRRLCDRVMAALVSPRHALGAIACSTALRQRHGMMCPGQALEAVAAMVREYHDSQFVMPGHTAHTAACPAQVPMDQPKHALDMITRFTRHEDFGARASAHLVSASSRTASSSAAAA